MTVTPEAFRAWIAPLVAGLRQLAAAIDATPGRHGELPSVPSVAISERAEEPQ